MAMAMAISAAWTQQRFLFSSAGLRRQRGVAMCCIGLQKPRVAELEVDVCDMGIVSRTIRMERWANMTTGERVDDWAGACNLWNLGGQVTVAAAFVNLLASQGIRSALAGCQAASAHGIPRTSRDLWFLADMDAAALAQLVASHPSQLKWIQRPVDQANMARTLSTVKMFGHLDVPCPELPVLPVLEACIGFRHSSKVWVPIHVSLNTWWGAQYALDESLEVQIRGQPARVIPAESWCLFDAIKGHPEPFELIDVLVFQDDVFVQEFVATALQEMFGQAEGQARVDWWHEQVLHIRSLERHVSVRDLPWKDGYCPYVEPSLG